MTTPATSDQAAQILALLDGLTTQLALLSARVANLEKASEENAATQSRVLAGLTKVYQATKPSVASTTVPKTAETAGKAHSAPFEPLTLEPASDADLDGTYGDETVRRDPKKWTGESFVGKRYSECTPEYLQATIDYFLWLAARQEEQGEVDKNGKPRAHWSRLSASRALGWKKRLESKSKHTTRHVKRGEKVPEI